MKKILNKKVKIVLNLIFVLLFLATTLALLLVDNFYSLNLEKTTCINSYNDFFDEEIPLENASGMPVTAVSIENLLSPQYITNTNYTPNQYIGYFDFLGGQNYEGENMNKCNNLKSITPTCKDTYQFVIAPISPFATDYQDKIDAMNKYIQGDGDLHIWVYFPKVYSACTIYVKTVLYNNYGELEGYDTIKYATVSRSMENYSTHTQGIYVECALSVKKNIIDPNIIYSSSVITIHYESREAKNGIVDYPIIGAKDEIEALVSAKYNMNILALTLASFVSVVFLVLLILQLNRKDLALMAMLILIVGYLYFNRSIITSIDDYASIKVVNIFALVTSIVLAMWYYIRNLHLIKQGQKLSSQALLISSIACFACNLVGGNFELAILVVLGLYLLNIYFEFFKTEKRNRYLMTNMEKEVAVRMQNLKNILEERDTLTSFISHDLKKYSKKVNDGLLKYKEDPNETLYNSLIDMSRLQYNSFAEISELMKSNFSLEKAEKVYVQPLFQEIYNEFEQDCYANGVILKVECDTKVVATVQKNALHSVISNLIFNSLDHSNCKNIRIEAKYGNNDIIINYIDDGTGINNIEPIFQAYFSTQDNNTCGNSLNGNGNLGLGLFMCKLKLQSMNGDIQLINASNPTIFEINLKI